MEDSEELDEDLRYALEKFERDHSQPDAVTHAAFEALRKKFKEEKLDVCNFIEDRQTQRMIGLCHLTSSRVRSRMEHLANSRWSLDNAMFIDTFGFRRTISQRFINELYNWEEHSRHSPLTWDEALELMKKCARKRRAQGSQPVASVEQPKRERVAINPRWVPMDIKDARAEHDRHSKMYAASDDEPVTIHGEAAAIVGLSDGTQQHNRPSVPANVGGDVTSNLDGKVDKPADSISSVSRGDRQLVQENISVAQTTNGPKWEPLPFPSEAIEAETGLKLVRATDIAVEMPNSPDQLLPNVNGRRRRNHTPSLEASFPDDHPRAKRRLPAIIEETESPQKYKRQRVHFQSANGDEHTTAYTHDPAHRHSIESSPVSDDIEHGRHTQEAMSEYPSDREDLFISDDDDFGYEHNSISDKHDDGEFAAQLASPPPSKEPAVHNHLAHSTRYPPSSPTQKSHKTSTIGPPAEDTSVVDLDSASPVPLTADRPVSTPVAARLDQPHAWLSDDDLYHVFKNLALCGWQLIQHLEPPPGVTWDQHSTTRERKGRKIRVHSDTSHLLVPVLRASHWILFCLDLTKKTVILYDSYSSLWPAAKQEKSTVADALVRIIGLNSSNDQWAFQEEPNVVQQEDSHSCGVHVLLNALHVMYGTVRESQSASLWRSLLCVQLKTSLLSDTQTAAALRSLISGAMQRSPSSPSTRTQDPLSDQIHDMLDTLSSQGFATSDSELQMAQRFLDIMHAKMFRNRSSLQEQQRSYDERRRQYQSQIDELQSSGAKVPLRPGEQKILEGAREMLAEYTTMRDRSRRRSEQSENGVTSIALMVKQLKILSDAFNARREAISEATSKARESLLALSKCLTENITG